jgi:hypothetical protein
MTTDTEINVDAMEDADVRAELESHGISLHHKTGSDKLKATLKDVLAGTYKVEADTQTSIPPDLDASVKRLTPEEHLKKLTKEQRALRMQRIVVSPNDPLMSSYNGLIFTAGSSAVNKGRMIKKYVPFNNDEGWYVPQIIVDQIDAAQMQKFRSVTAPNGDKVLEPYLTKKFNVQILPPLTPAELERLAAAQQSKR